jgi:hypothetical protein
MILTAGKARYFYFKLSNMSRSLESNATGVQAQGMCREFTKLIRRNYKKKFGLYNFLRDLKSGVNIKAKASVSLTDLKAAQDLEAKATKTFTKAINN